MFRMARALLCCCLGRVRKVPSTSTYLSRRDITHYADLQYHCGPSGWLGCEVARVKLLQNSKATVELMGSLTGDRSWVRDAKAGWD
jgi:hypothetical protein